MDVGLIGVKRSSSASNIRRGDGFPHSPNESSIGESFSIASSQWSTLKQARTAVPQQQQNTTTIRTGRKPKLGGDTGLTASDNNLNLTFGGRTGGRVIQEKSGRLKVGIRCRPAFQDEIDFTGGNFFSIIETQAETAEQLGQVSLTLMSGKQRDFLYDYVFGPNSTQDQVYERIARPVVTDVLKGFNGTIFAYGKLFYHPNPNPYGMYDNYGCMYVAHSNDTNT